VAEGDVFLVWAGEGGIGMTSGGAAAAKGAYSKFERSALQYAAAAGGLPGTATTAGSPGAGEITTGVSGWGPGWTFYGQWGDIYNGGMGGGGAGNGGGSQYGERRSTCRDWRRRKRWRFWAHHC
jgi:hypothetical protein